LCYSAFGEWVPEGRFQGTMPFEKFLELMKENMFIINSNIGFRKPISTDEEVQGQIELMKIKKHGSLYIALLDYNLEQGKSRGNLELAVKL